MLCFVFLSFLFTYILIWIKSFLCKYYSFAQNNIKTYLVLLGNACLLIFFPTSVWLRNCLASVPTALENSKGFDSFGDRTKQIDCTPHSSQSSFCYYYKIKLISMCKILWKLCTYHSLYFPDSIYLLRPCSLWALFGGAILNEPSLNTDGAPPLTSVSF